MSDALNMLKLAKQIANDRKGVTAMEYGLIAGVIAVGLATAFAALRDKITGALSGISFS